MRAEVGVGVLAEEDEALFWLAWARMDLGGGPSGDAIAVLRGCAKGAEAGIMAGEPGVKLAAEDDDDEEEEDEEEEEVEEELVVVCASPTIGLALDLRTLNQNHNDTTHRPYTRI